MTTDSTTADETLPNTGRHGIPYFVGLYSLITVAVLSPLVFMTDTEPALTAIWTITGGAAVLGATRSGTGSEWVKTLQYYREHAAVMDITDAMRPGTPGVTTVYEATEPVGDESGVERFYPELGVAELTDGRLRTVLSLKPTADTEDSVEEWRQLRGNLARVFQDTEEDDEAGLPVEFDFQLYVTNSVLSRREITDVVASSRRGDAPILAAHHDSSTVPGVESGDPGETGATGLYLVLDTAATESTSGTTDSMGKSNWAGSRLSSAIDRCDRLETACDQVLERYTAEKAATADWVRVRETGWRRGLAMGETSDWQRTVPGAVPQTLHGNEKRDTLADTVLAALFERSNQECDLVFSYAPVPDEEGSTDHYSSSVSISLYGETEPHLSQEFVTVSGLFRDCTDIELQPGRRLT